MYFMLHKKKAFSYIELLFGMVIVVIIFTASIPFVTRKSLSQPALPGAFACFTAFDNDLNQWRLFQTMKRGDGNFSELQDVTTTGCVFYKQKNINSYNVSVIGGGGAANLNRSASSRQFAVGLDGQTISIPNTNLAGVWDENNALTIRACRSAGLKRAVIPYEKEYDYCVGTGGVAHRSVSVGSSGTDEAVYTELLGVYQDMLYESRTNIDTVNYVGLGNGALDDDDYETLNYLTGGTNKNNIRNAVERYLSMNAAQRQSISAKEDLFDATKNLRTLISNNNYTATGNHGGMGGYSRFILYDKHPLDCVNGFGDCVAKGGVGGGFDGTSYSAVTVGSGASNNNMQEDIENLISTGISDVAALSGYMGQAGEHGILGERRQLGRSTYDTLGAPVGNGGAIIISW